MVGFPGSQNDHFENIRRSSRSLTSSIEILGMPHRWGRQEGQVLLNLLCHLLPRGQVRPQFPDPRLPGPVLPHQAANPLHPPALPLLRSAGGLRHLRPGPPALLQSLGEHLSTMQGPSSQPPSYCSICSTSFPSQPSLKVPVKLLRF